jgi:hypothetical protein
MIWRWGLGGWLVACGGELAYRPGKLVDEVIQVEAAVVDVLWVIDNSSSMSNEREALAEAFLAFAEPLQVSRADAHIGVISTDMASPSQRGVLQEVEGHRWVEPDMPDFVRLFTDMATFAGSPPRSSTEKGRLAIHTALERAAPGGTNHGFFRDDPAIYLHVVIVSDEDDGTTDAELTEATLVQELRDLKPLADRLSLSAVVPVDRHGTTPAPSYVRLAEALGGVVAPLEEGGWSELNGMLGELLAPPPMQEFFLSFQPELSSLEVQVREPGGDWERSILGVEVFYDPQRISVRFMPDAIPRLGSTVRISYLPAG